MEKSYKAKNVLIYCRESRDDGFLNYEKIETQKDILVSYCKNKNLGNIVDIILDDNKSGTDFARLEPIKQKIINGDIDILLLKDASRLGRNVLESLTFTRFLEQYKVQLIFESEEYNEDMFPLIAWFNERRAKEDSMKIRRVLKHKMETGTMVIKAPYGYIKEGCELIIDESSARVVREIFELFIEGYSKYEIANIMNEKKYPTPSQLKRQYENTNRTCTWNRQHIDRILNHVIYTGDMPYGMREKVSFKSKKYINISKENWIIKKNHHPAIVSKEIFEKTQLKMKRYCVLKYRNINKNIFSGLLFCGRCGSKMYIKTQKGKKTWYCCGKNVKEGSYGCSSHRIQELTLIDIVEKYIKALITSDNLKNVILKIIDEYEKNKPNKIKEINIIKSKIDSLKLKASKVYEDKLENKLPEYLFYEKIEEINRELNTHMNNLTQLSELKDEPLSITDNITLPTITHQIIELLFKKIIIFNPNDITPSIQDECGISYEDYKNISESGGIVFIQNFCCNVNVNNEISYIVTIDIN